MTRSYRRPRTYKPKVAPRPCPDCGEKVRPGEPLVVHVPGCRYEIRVVQR